MSAHPRPGEILFLGDLHGHYGDADAAFLEQRSPRLAVFVGDLGDEDVEITKRVVDVDVDVKVLLGNHDAWESFHQKRVTPALGQILGVLGDDHLAYTTVDLPELGVTLLGARPFSWGGPSLRSPEVYGELYGVREVADSTARIVAAAERARFQNLLVVAHNGPYGLGGRPGDIWGKDFGKPGGDWGDIDLRNALRELKARGFRVPLVVAGHMHHRLFHPKGEMRRRCVVKPDTVYVNPARVPRVFEARDGTELRHYLSARFEGGVLRELFELYVSGSERHAVPLIEDEATERAAPAG